MQTLLERYQLNFTVSGDTIVITIMNQISVQQDLFEIVADQRMAEGKEALFSTKKV